MHSTTVARITALLVSASTGALSAQRIDTTAPRPFDPAVARAVVERASQVAESLYVFPDRGRALADTLRRRSAQGAYDGAHSAAELAATLTNDMRAVSGDLHFQLFTALAGRIVGSPAGVGSMEDRQRALLARERRMNFFFTRTELLPGGVAYVRLDQFPTIPDSARAAVAAVMRTAAAASAVVLDFRRNPGGGEGINQLLSSYFYPPDTSRVLYERYFREGNRTSRIRVLPEVDGPRSPTVPLYVLISRRTGSAAENMAYHLRASGRAVIVGERSAGAANTSRPVPLVAGYTLTVPIARVVSPITGTNWEGGGIQPDLACPPDSALDVAYVAALERIAGAVSDSATREVQRRALAVARARRGVVTATPAELSRFAGRYGDWSIAAANGGLRVGRVEGPAYHVFRVAPDTFAMLDEPEVQFAFQRSAAGGVTALSVLQPSGEWLVVPRTSGRSDR